MRRSCSERSRKSLLTSARTTQRFSAARPAATVTWWTITITPVHNVRKGVGRAPGLGGVPASINASLASAAACCLPTRPAKWTRTTDTYSNGPKEEAAALKCSRLADKRSATPCVELRAGTARLLRVAGDVLSPAPTNSTITPTTVIVNSGAAIGSVSQFSYAVRRRLMQPPHSCPDRHLLVTRICSCASTGASSASRTSSLGHTACQPMDPQARPHICEARITVLSLPDLPNPARHLAALVQQTIESKYDSTLPTFPLQPIVREPVLMHGRKLNQRHFLTVVAGASVPEGPLRLFVDQGGLWMIGEQDVSNLNRRARCTNTSGPLR